MSAESNDEIRRDVPVVLWCWTRPAETYRVFQQIRKFRPQQLLVRSDGPRPSVPGDKLKVNLVRRIIDEGIDWDCELFMIRPERNEGMLPRREQLFYTSKSGKQINHEDIEMYIGLEDDDLPTQGFFRFTTELLRKYYHDERIFLISGNNFQRGIQRGDGSYYFSYLTHTWGAGFWRHKMQDFGVKIKWLRENFSRILAGEIPFPETVPPEAIRYYLEHCKRVCYGDLKNVTNDFLRVLYTFIFNKWTVLPNANLVQNIGFGMDGINCNTANATHPLSIEAKEIAFPLTHPAEVALNVEADLFYYRNYLGIPC